MSRALVDARQRWNQGVLADSNEVQQDVAHRAARLYRFDERAYKQLAKDGLHFEI